VRIRRLARVVLKDWPRGLKNCIYGRVHGSKIHPSCRIGNDAEVIRSVLGFRAAVAHHGSVRRSIIGRHTSIGRFSKVNGSTIGAFCSISWDCTIGAHNDPWIGRKLNHYYPYEYSSSFLGRPRLRGKESWRENNQFVLMGSDVWVGTGSLILDGVQIGDGSVIAAGSVVTQSVPPFTVVAGVPARPLRPRFDEKICEMIIRIRWWDWPDAKIEKHIGLFKVPMTYEVARSLEELCEY